jgi:hypothetical protein
MNVLVCAAFLAVALAYLGDSDNGVRPGEVDIREDCEVGAGGNIDNEFPNPGAEGTETACLFKVEDDDDDNGKFCTTADGFHRGVTGYTTNGANCPAPGGASKKRDVEEARDTIKFKVPFRYVRSDEDINDGQLSCAPEIRVVVDGEVVAHTDARYKEGGQTWPALGEGVFRFKASLARNIQHDVVFQYRDGPDCDEFDDDDSADSTQWEDFDPIDSCNDKKKRNVESSSSSSSSGTTVSVSSVAEDRRITCVALNDAALLETDDSSSSSSSSSK